MDFWKCQCGVRGLQSTTLHTRRGRRKKWRRGKTVFEEKKKMLWCTIPVRSDNLRKSFTWWFRNDALSPSLAFLSSSPPPPPIHPLICFYTVQKKKMVLWILWGFLMILVDIFSFLYFFSCKVYAIYRFVFSVTFYCTWYPVCVEFVGWLKKGVHLHGMEAPQVEGRDVSLIVLSMMRDNVWKWSVEWLKIVFMKCGRRSPSLDVVVLRWKRYVLEYDPGQVDNKRDARVSELWHCIWMAFGQLLPCISALIC